MTKKTLYIYRHGRTRYNLEHRVQGRGVNSSLDAHGLAQRDAFFEHYKSEGFELLLASSLKRSQESIAPFGLQLEQDIWHWPELDEVSWGIFEGQASTPKMHQNYKALMNAWGRGEYKARIPKGESALEMAGRLRLALHKIEQLPQQKILICTHGATLSFLSALLQGQELKALQQYKHHNTGLSIFEQDGPHYRLKAQNEIEHLRLRNLLD
ncbi:fructose-2,6-bisphosphatase [Saprospira grandis DSM 2844]|uniref:Fructose-2,6-bisphosphatase n=1 Tax=Saprospira grandis DSM 2844 TaxID=694433 RepID=J0XZH0_9BACT|nr:histidine phosphatase family protein [Saprospira grandis]EJF54596.1 fructose-2,6-bisphosphatase [Saprospira grandis DSM 2844]